MNELSDRFLDEGEIIYAAKVYDAVALTGKERIQLNVSVETQRIETVRVYWNNNEGSIDSIDINVAGRTGVFKEMLEPMPENGYIFQLISFDKFGNRSLPVEATGESLGENYQSGLLNRNINSLGINTDLEKEVAWGSIDTERGAKYSEVLYNGITYKIPATDEKSVISGYMAGTELQYRTVYVPALSIDTFYTGYKVFTYESDYFKLAKTGWTVENFSSNHGGDNVVAHIIDGIYDNRWHSTDQGSNSEYTGEGTNGYPHHVTIDMKRDITVAQFGIWPSVFDLSAGQTVDSRSPTSVEFWVSTDNETWTKFGPYPHDNTITGEQIYPIPPTLARYFKLIGVERTDSGDAPMVLGEIDVYIQ
ncbi:hypothetical protein AGMMS49965_24460 [Bacteroidia bacterium]|nr:hypothetical protein AGMMS49965_24460 [Bacteroidia bacterium]